MTARRFPGAAVQSAPRLVERLLAVDREQKRTEAEVSSALTALGHLGTRPAAGRYLDSTRPTGSGPVVSASQAVCQVGAPGWSWVWR